MTTKTTNKGDGGTQVVTPDFYFWLGEDAELIPTTEEEFDAKIAEERLNQRKFREVIPD